MVKIDYEVKQIKDVCRCEWMGTVYRRCRSTGKVMAFPNTLFIEDAQESLFSEGAHSVGSWSVQAGRDSAQ